MRPGQHNKRGRNRHRTSGGGGSSGGGSSGGGSGGNPLSRVYESNGPDVKVRGNAQTVAEKYLQLGRDALSASDIVGAENYFQHAEHYLRIVSAAQAYQQQMQPQQYRRLGEEMEDDEGDETPEQAFVEPRNQPQPQIQSAEQPDTGGDQPFEAERQQQQNFRSQRDRDPQQGGQHNQGNRDRNRSRWQDRRDQQPSTNVEPRQAQPQPRFEDQPRELAPTPAPAPRAEAAVETGQWEAPSFLRRPSPLPPPEPEMEVVEAEASALAAPERKRRVRREKPVEAVETTIPEPAGD